MCRSPAGRGDVHIDGKKTGQKVIPKCQEYLRMKSSILSDNNMVEFLANDDKVQEQKTKFENAKGTVRNSRYDIITLLITPEVALFATLPPFRNTFSESLDVAKRGTTGVLHMRLRHLVDGFNRSHFISLKSQKRL